MIPDDMRASDSIWRMTRRALLLFIALPVFAWQRPTLPAAKIEQVEKIVSAEMSRLGIPGLSLAIALDGRLRYASGFGLADVENNVPATARTVYRLASISKPITATAVLQLVERGRVDLDEPVWKYVPAFPQKPWPVTVRQLLCHQGGVRHYRGEEISSTRHYTDLTAPLDIFKNDPLLFEPGTRTSYTTYGYNLLGCVVEAASGMRFAEYLEENIFRPAGCERLRTDNHYEIIPGRAQGYRRDASGRLLNAGPADTSNKIPGGGLCGTAADLVRFALAVHGGVLLKPDTLEIALARQKLRSGKPTSYGLGWSIGEFEGRKTVSHGGAQQRVRTLLWAIPERRFVLAWMCNLEGVNPRIAEEAARVLLE